MRIAPNEVSNVFRLGVEIHYGISTVVAPFRKADGIQ